jgi:hypothetical protein
VPVRLFDGYPSPLGNHSMLYPKIQFIEDKVLVMSSHCSDGSVQNTYDKVILHTIPVSDPSSFTEEVVFEGDSGYYSYGFDMLIVDNNIFCAFLAGQHKYGPIVEDAVKPGLYISSRPVSGETWNLNMVHDQPGCVTIASNGSENELFALVTEGSWFAQNKSMLKKSADMGETWQLVIPDLLISEPKITGQYFFQSVQTNSGSTVNQIDALFSVIFPEKTDDDLYKFDLMYMHIPVN